MNDKYEDFLNKLRNTDESERDWLVMEFSLQNLSEVLQQAVWAAAVPHWFDHAYLNAVLGFLLKDEDFNALTRLSFVEVFPQRGFNVHERSRSQLLDHLYKNDKARYQKLSKQAAAFCKKQNQSDPAWRIETLYHGLLANNAAAKQSFINQASVWSDSFQYNKLEKLIRVILVAVNSGQLIGEVAAWTAFSQARLDIIFSRYSSAQLFLKQALKHTTSKILIANCILYLGNVHCYFAEYDQARSYYQHALRLNKQMKKNAGEANCIQALGDVHYILAEYNQARDLYQKALSIYQEINERLGEASCIQGLGLIDGAEQQIELASTRLQQAAQLFKTFGNKLCQSTCLNDLAILYQRQKQFPSALAAFNQAIEIFPKRVNWYQNRAALYMEIENYPAAEDDIRQAETIGENPAYTLLRKAEFALWQQQPPQAVEFCRQALAQRPTDGNLRAFFALTLQADGQADLACAEMEQALIAVYHKHNFDGLSDALGKLSRIYGDSVEADALRNLVLNRCRE